MIHVVKKRSTIGIAIRHHGTRVRTRVVRTRAPVFNSVYSTMVWHTRVPYHMVPNGTKWYSSTMVRTYTCTYHGTRTMVPWYYGAS